MARAVETSRVAGVDFDGYTVRLALVEGTGSDASVADLRAFRVGDELVDEQVVRRSREVARSLSEIRRSWGRVDAVFSIGSESATLEWLNLTGLRRERKNLVAGQRMRGILPFPVEDSYVCLSSPQDFSDGTTETLAIGIPRSIASSRAEALSLAGFSPVRAELETQALTRLVRSKTAGSVMLLHLGERRTHMSLVEGGRIRLLRTLEFATESVARKVADELTIPSNAAFEMLEDPETVVGLDGNIGIAGQVSRISILVRSELSTLAREASEVIECSRREGWTKPERAVVAGSLSGIPGLSRFLSQEFAVEVEPLDPWWAAKPESVPTHLASTFSVAIGLSLSQFELQEVHSEDVELDFIRPRT